MIVLFTDFGLTGPYTGQMKAVLAVEASGVPIIDLFADAPAFDPKASAYLLAAYAAAFPTGSVFLCVVDPGVGGERAAMAVEADGQWFVGPDNGLFEMVVRRGRAVRRFEILWRPERLSASFHGRDLFAPVAARLSRGDMPQARAMTGGEGRREDWPDDWPGVVYVDGYGNALTGLRARALAPDTVLEAAGRRFAKAWTFSDLPPGQGFWYENANGLAEIAVNRGSAAALGLTVGQPVGVTRA